MSPPYIVRIEPCGGVGFIREFGQAPQFTHGFCVAMNVIDPRVHDGEYVCRWTAPYGFAPEAGCPVHD